MTLDEQLAKMRRDWDRRATENARYFIATSNENWTDEEFFQSGRGTVRDYILNDLTNVCQGRDPKKMRVLEIGCGAGRVTHALAEIFGEVHGVDVSGEMIGLARKTLVDSPNAHVYKNNGKDLDVLPTTSDSAFDFAFSCIVFQHIPSPEVIANYISETSRLLKSGSLFKFQLQGCACVSADPQDTWVGAAFSEEMARSLAENAKFEMRYAHGAGTQDFWLWFFRR